MLSSTFIHKSFKLKHSGTNKFHYQSSCGAIICCLVIRDKNVSAGLFIIVTKMKHMIKYLNMKPVNKSYNLQLY